MLCPLRKMIKSANFEKCYREECEWWVSTVDPFGYCSITIIAKALEGIKVDLEPLVVSKG